MNSAELTVVVCTHNRVQLLQRCVAALNEAQQPAAGAQLLVVANACSDGTHAFLAGYGQSPGQTLPLRWLAEPRPGKSHALNRALSVVDTELIAFVDDDQRADPAFLTAISSAARNWPDADLYFGRLLPDWDGTEPPWVHTGGRYRIYPLPVPTNDLGLEGRWRASDDPIPSGGNLVVRRRVWAQVGSFSTQLGPTGHNLAGGEDAEWFLRALRLGARVRYLPDLVQFHYVDPARLTLGFMMRFAFERTAAAVSVDVDTAVRVPSWAYRKLLSHFGSALLSWSMQRRRFYLIRTAASLGEISGYRRRVMAKN